MQAFKVGQVWPDGEENNKYWIGCDPMAAREHHGGPVRAGDFFSSHDELDAVAASMRADLESAIAEASKKLATHVPSP